MSKSRCFSAPCAMCDLLSLQIEAQGKQEEAPATLM